MRLILIFALTIFSHLVLANSLNTKDIELWIKTYPELENWLEQQEQTFDESGLEGTASLDFDNMFEYAVKQLKQSGVYNKLDKEVVAAGFESAEQWLKLSHRISMVFLSLIWDEQVGNREEIQQQLKQLEAADMPEEHKAMMRNMAESSLKMLDVIESITEEEKKVAAPFFEQLGNLIGD